MGFGHRVAARAKHLGHQLGVKAKQLGHVVDRGLYHAGRLAHALPEPLVEQVAGREAGEALRAAKRGLGAYEGVRQLATGAAR